MKRGLVIGKFMPLHKGHIALIEFAASRCDEVIVSMSYTPNDPIDYALRFSWIKDYFQSNARIKAFIIEDDFDNENLPLNERTSIWADVMRKTYPKIDFIFSSEDYGEPFAGKLNAKHVSFDQSRLRVPVSATLIRNYPFKYWDYIPDIVRPYFVKAICLYGPESTGKSTMSQHLAKVYNTAFVPEVARELITSNDFSVDDIIKIGNAQTARVLEKKRTANKILFCDTDVITTQIYSQHYLNHVPEVLYQLEKQIKYDHYFLMNTDTPWVADGLRDLGNEREKMFMVFKNALDSRKIPYTIISGNYEQREEQLRSYVDTILTS